jgi:hypothetical protein
MPWSSVAPYKTLVTQIAQKAVTEAPQGRDYPTVTAGHGHHDFPVVMESLESMMAS